ncbi:MAG TPA: choline/ethanolamine kinase family protein [Solirubrobacteraceae bacterium]|nr:choline/ethanolamine kinase family protein [Solirubrobacteraceae bacterium]
MDEQLARIVALLEPDLGPPAGEPQVLSGGITNRNVRVRLGEGDYVLRICGRDTEVLSIDRETEVAATRNAHAAGIGPAVVRWIPEERCLVTGFIPGTPIDAEQLREPGRLAEVARALARVHAGPALATRFPTFELATGYAQAARERGGAVPEDDAAFARELSERIRAALRGPEHAPVACHNDLLTANFIDDGERLRIVDWEYAGMNDRYFDLGNLSVNNGLDEDDDRVLLEAYFGEPATERRLAAVRLMRLMSDVREALWGVLQGVLSELDVDYEAYAAEHFARLRAAAQDPRLEEWLHGAAA